MPAMLPRRLLPWLFALALLLGQTTAFAHTLSHLGAQDEAPPDPVCEVCVAQAQLGSAAPGPSFIPAVAAAAFVLSAIAAVPPGRQIPRHAPARAPPATV